MENYDYPKKLWNFILPNGSIFCHWGGRDISYRVLELLDLRDGEKVCDICCGEAGTLALIDNPLVRSYGIDISNRALEEALRNLDGKANLIRADIRRLPFKSGLFNKIFAQDPDVFLCPSKQPVMNEISRITHQGGSFVLQTYCETSDLRKRDRENTGKILRETGYTNTDVICIRELTELVERAGFKIKYFRDLSDVYSRDNLRMINNLERNWSAITQLDGQQGRALRRLLEWEKYLFLNKMWTGILLGAEKQ